MKCSQARPATAEPWSWPRTLPPPPPPGTVGLLAQFPLPEEENITYLLPQAARDLVTALQSSRISMQGPTPAAGLYLQRDILQCLSLTLIEWARWAQRGKGTARGLWQKCIPLHRATKTRKKSLCLPAPAQHSPWDRRDKPTRVRQSHHGDTAGDAPVQEVGRSHTPSSSSELFSLAQHDLFQTTDCVSQEQGVVMALVRLPRTCCALLSSWRMVPAGAEDFLRPHPGSGSQISSSSSPLKAL